MSIERLPEIILCPGSIKINDYPYILCPLTKNIIHDQSNQEEKPIKINCLYISNIFSIFSLSGYYPERHAYSHCKKQNQKSQNQER